MKCAARLRARGQITIPHEILEALKLKTGDLLTITVQKLKWYEMLDWSELNIDFIRELKDEEAKRYALNHRNLGYKE